MNSPKINIFCRIKINFALSQLQTITVCIHMEKILIKKAKQTLFCFNFPYLRTAVSDSVKWNLSTLISDSVKCKRTKVDTKCVKFQRWCWSPKWLSVKITVLRKIRRVSIPACSVPTHTEELWYNETVCLWWQRIYIYIYMIFIYFIIYQRIDTICFYFIIDIFYSRF